MAAFFNRGAAFFASNGRVRGSQLCSGLFFLMKKSSVTIYGPIRMPRRPTASRPAVGAMGNVHTVETGSRSNQLVAATRPGAMRDGHCTPVLPCRDVWPPLSRGHAQAHRRDGGRDDGSHRSRRPRAARLPVPRIAERRRPEGLSHTVSVRTYAIGRDGPCSGFCLRHRAAP